MHASLKNYTDSELVTQYKSNQQTSIVGEFYSRYSHLVYGVCMKYLKDSELAKDAMMQIFEKLFVDLKRHDIEFFKAWLYRVSQNYCLMQLRSNKHLTKSVDEYPELGMEYKDELHPIEEKENLLSQMEYALSELNEEQKKCVTLFYLEQKSYQEIMDLTGYSFMQVKSHIQNAKRNLKLKMERLK